MADEKVKQIRLTNILVDEGIQPRAGGLDDGHVTDIIAAIEAGEELPPLVLYQNAANSLLLSEGFHRYEAYKRAGIKHAPCIVRKGERADALANACGSNTRHGLKRTNADKRRAVGLLLEAFPQWSNPKVAEGAAVSVEFVRKIRPTEPGEKRQGADGKDRSPPRQPQHSNNNQPATVAGCESGNAEENAGFEPEREEIEVTEESPSGEPEPVEPESEDPEEPGQPPTLPMPAGAARDGIGGIIPRGLLDTFGDPMLAEAIARIDAAHKEIISIERHVVGTLARKGEFWPYALFGECAKSLLSAADRAAEASAQLAAGVPFCVCPVCKGDGCKDCRNAGAWPRHRYGNRSQYGEAA